MDTTHTVTVTTDGIRRDYGCRTYFDAVVLADAMDRMYGPSAEIWQGATCLSRPAYIIPRDPWEMINELSTPTR